MLGFAFSSLAGLCPDPDQGVGIAPHIACSNCDTETEGASLCQACQWLSQQRPDSNDLFSRGTALDRLTNRRWQMRFNRGELPTEPEGISLIPTWAWNWQHPDRRVILAYGALAYGEKRGD